MNYIINRNSKTAIFLAFLIIFCQIFLFGSQNGSQHIPEDAIFVFSMKMQKFNEYGKPDDEITNEIIEYLKNQKIDEEYEGVQKSLDKDMKTGLDENGIIHIFLSADFSKDMDLKQMGFIVPLTDKNIYEKMLIDTTIIENISEIKKYKTFSYYNLEEVLMIWNKSELIVLYSETENYKEVSIKEIGGIIDKFSKSDKLLSKKSFKTLQEQPWDFSSWLNMGPIMKAYINSEFNYEEDAVKYQEIVDEYTELAEKYRHMAEEYPYEGDYEYFNDGSEYVEIGDYKSAAEWYERRVKREKRSADYYKELHEKYTERNKKAIKNYKDMNLTFRGEFLNGKLDFNFDVFTGKNLSFPKSSKNKLKNNMLKYIPKEFVCFFGANFEIEEYYNFLQEISFGDYLEGMDNFEEGINKELEITVKEFLNMFSGDFTFSISEYDINTKKIEMILAAKVNNKSTLDKLLNKMEEGSIKKETIKNTELYYDPDSSDKNKPYFMVQDNIMYIVTEKLKNLIIKNSSAKPAFDKKKGTINSKNSLISFLDYGNLIKSLHEKDKELDRLDKLMLDIKKEIKEIKLTIDTVSEKNLNINLSIDLKNKKENSLKTIKDLAEKHYKEDKKEREKKEDGKI